MRFNSYNSSSVSPTLGPQITPGVKKLIIINVVVFLFQLFFSNGRSISLLESLFALNPELVEKGYLWQFGTYHLLHSRFSFFHIIFNMLSLWMFGSEIEKVWGEKTFVKFYLICSIGAGFFIYIIPRLLGDMSGFTIGASGAIFGILFVYALFWPNRIILVMFVFPLRIKYFVLFIGILEFILTLRSSNAGGISHVGHIGGIITAYFYLLYNIRKRTPNMQYPSNFPFQIFEKPSTLFQIIWRKIRSNVFFQKSSNFKPTNPFEKETINTSQNLDQILEKITKKGMKNLSKEEKLFLKNISEQMNDENTP